MKTMIGIALAAASLLMTAKPARANTTAGELQSYCKTAEANHDKGALTAENGFCVGYVAGFLETVDGTIYRVDGKFYGVKIARTTTPGEVVVTFVHYMETYPDKVKSDDGAPYALLVALMKAKILAMTTVAENSMIQ